MEIPDDVIPLIKEYSMPITRPDWRHLHRMNNQLFLRNIGESYNRKYLSVIHNFVHTYEKTPNTRYKYIRYSYKYTKPIAFVVYNDH